MFFRFTLTKLLSLPLDIPALMMHTWINHTVRQTAAHSMIMQIRETPLCHAISTTACFLAAASMIIRRSAMACATDMHHWAATMGSFARDSFFTKLILKIKLPAHGGQANEHQAHGCTEELSSKRATCTWLNKEAQRYSCILPLCVLVISICIACSIVCTLTHTRSFSFLSFLHFLSLESCLQHWMFRFYVSHIVL